jgi:hypothetical protein
LNWLKKNCPEEYKQRLIKKEEKKINLMQKVEENKINTRKKVEWQKTENNNINSHENYQNTKGDQELIKMRH